jgi:hypothetical protein
MKTDVDHQHQLLRGMGDRLISAGQRAANSERKLRIAMGVVNAAIAECSEDTAIGLYARNALKRIEDIKP